MKQKTSNPLNLIPFNFWTERRKGNPFCPSCAKHRIPSSACHPHTVYRIHYLQFYEPLRWSTAQRIEVCPCSDFFVEGAEAWREGAWQVIEKAKRHQWHLLTERPERISSCLPEDWGEKGYSNVWLGVRLESQQALAQRLALLKQVPAALRFLSIEPLLGEVVFKEGDLEGIHWVIIGGESGNETGKYRYRPCQMDWIVSLIEQCKAAGVPVFVKQTGTALAKELKLQDRHGGVREQWPEAIQVREFPVIEVKDRFENFFE